VAPAGPRLLNLKNRIFWHAAAPCWSCHYQCWRLGFRNLVASPIASQQLTDYCKTCKHLQMLLESNLSLDRQLSLPWQYLQWNTQKQLNQQKSSYKQIGSSNTGGWSACSGSRTFLSPVLLECWWMLISLSPTVPTKELQAEENFILSVENHRDTSCNMISLDSYIYLRS
jgi:hypothetical protein